MKFIWTKPLIVKSKQILNQHYKLTDAIEAIAHKTGFIVTRDSLEKAFKRHGENTPFSHLKRPVMATKQMTMSPLEKTDSDIERKKNQVAFRELGRTEYIMRGIETALSNLKPVTVRVNKAKEIKTQSKIEEIPFFTISDVHIGSLIEPHTINGMNNHNHSSFLQKLAIWESEAIVIIKERQQSVTIKNVVCYLGGDLCDGHDIFGGQAFEQTHDQYAQLIEGSQAFATSFIKIANTFPKIQFTFPCVAGNHGRIGKKGESTFRSNYDILLTKMIELIVKASKTPNIAFIISESWFMLYKTFDTTHLLVHGDFVKAAPPNGLKNTLLKYSQMLNTTINVAHAGHTHSEICMATSNGDVLVNGSWTGRNAYSMRELGEGNTPVQVCHGFQAGNGLVWTRKIFLSNRSDFPTTPKIYS